MSYEAGSRDCRNLIEAKENLIRVMESIDGLKSVDHMQEQLKSIYNELEALHEIRRNEEAITLEKKNSIFLSAPQAKIFF